MQTEKQEVKVHELFDCFNQAGKEVFDDANKIDLIKNLKELHKRSSYIGQVTEFMNVFKQESNNSATIPNSKIIELRLSLLLEEITELAESCGVDIAEKFRTQLINKSCELDKKIQSGKIENTNLINIFDAFIDTQYVLSGAIIAFGMQHQFDEGFEEVHKSNMTKACSSYQEAMDTKNHYNLKGVECFVDVTDFNLGIWRVLRTGDHKLLKSINYQPANLSFLKLNEDGF